MRRHFGWTASSNAEKTVLQCPIAEKNEFFSVGGLDQANGQLVTEIEEAQIECLADIDIRSFIHGSGSARQVERQGTR